MKLLWVSHFLLFPDSGFGALQRSKNLLIELSKYYEIIYVSYYRSVDIDGEVSLDYVKSDLMQYCSDVILIPHPFSNSLFFKYGILIKSLASFKPYTVLLNEFKILKKEILKMLKKENIDLLYSDTLGLSDSVINNIDVPSVLNHHNVESDMMFHRAKKEKKLLLKMFIHYEAIKCKKYEQKYCPRYSKNIVVSDTDKERLLKISPSVDVDVVENGVNCTYFEFHPRTESEPELIFTGGLDWYPNLDAMLYFCKEVWPLITKELPNIKLTIIGKNPGTELDNYVHKYKNINITGFVPDVREYMKKATIFICPIRDGGGTKLKILDAMAQGVPIISSALGCEGIDSEDGIHLLIANKPEEYLLAIEKLIYDTAEQRRLAKNALNLVNKKYSYEIIGKKLSNIIGEL